MDTKRAEIQFLTQISTPCFHNKFKIIPTKDFGDFVELILIHKDI